MPSKLIFQVVNVFRVVNTSTVVIAKGCMSIYSWGHNPYINRNPKVVFLQIDFSESDNFDFDSNIVRR